MSRGLPLKNSMRRRTTMSQKPFIYLERSLTLLVLNLVAILLFPVLGVCQGPAQKSGMQKTPATETNETSGAKLYHSHCAACHGPNGKGNGPAASALKTASIDLTMLAKNNGN